VESESESSDKPPKGGTYNAGKVLESVRIPVESGSGVTTQNIGVKHITFNKMRVGIPLVGPVGCNPDKRSASVTTQPRMKFLTRPFLMLFKVS